MSAQKNVHSYLNWAKERIEEMDAALPALEADTNRLRTDIKAKGDQILGDLKKRREEFKAVVEKQAEAGETAWAQAKTQLDELWSAFEAQLKTYLESVGKGIAQRQVLFHDVAVAQAKAWRQSADQFRDAAVKVGAANRAEFDAAIERMKTQATEAEARLEKLNKAGNESWSILSAALAESRKAFDRANQETWNAFKKAHRD